MTEQIQKHKAKRRTTEDLQTDLIEERNTEQSTRLKRLLGKAAEVVERIDEEV